MVQEMNVRSDGLHGYIRAMQLTLAGVRHADIEGGR
jgi:hypothetical protein